MIKIVNGIESIRNIIYRIIVSRRNTKVRRNIIEIKKRKNMIEKILTLSILPY